MDTLLCSNRGFGIGVAMLGAWVISAAGFRGGGDETSLLEAYRESFPSASRAETVVLDPRRYQSAQMVEIYNGEELLGYGVTLTVTSRSGKFRMQVAVSADNTVMDVKVPDYPHARGRAVRKSRFLRQFKGYAYGEPLKLGEQVDGVSGATSSATAVTGGVRRALIMVHRHIGGK